MLTPSLAPTADSAGPSLVVAVRAGRVAISSTTEPPGDQSAPYLFIGTLDGRHCWAVDANDDIEVPVGEVGFVDLMRLFAEVDEQTWAAAGRAVQLVDWARNHRYCGHCGRATQESSGERAFHCPACGLKVFPRLAPAIIALVERSDGRALLARNANWPPEMYSCLAGFVEPGESVESAARREIFEEVGVEIGNLRYFGSQPWPFPHSLMLGFHAEYLRGDIICDGLEIADAQWFSPDDLPGIPGSISIARRLIDDWAARAS